MRRASAFLLPLILISILALACSKGGGSSSSSSGGNAGPAFPYTGIWNLSHTTLVNGNATCESGTTGVPQANGTVTFSSSGGINETANSNGWTVNGTVDSAGAMSGTIPTNGFCITDGTFTGICSSTSTCSATFSRSSVTGTLSFTR